MQIHVNTPEEYIAQLPADRKEAIRKLREVIRQNLPEGYAEVMAYGMIGYVVPHSLYPKGYHTDPNMPLPFMSLASQKNHVAVYHMGIYSQPELLEWFQKEYPKHCETRLDMGKSCIRFRKVDQVPYALIGELASKITPEAWIKTYEHHFYNK